jgi:hypothetical protein
VAEHLNKKYGMTAKEVRFLSTTCNRITENWKLWYLLPV